MKRLLMPLLAIFAVVTLYSCSDDNSDPDPVPAPPKPSEIVKGTYDAANLVLSVEGAASAGAKVTVETASETAVKITLEKAIFGYDKVIAAAIPVSATKADATVTTYYIKGSHTVDNLTLTFDGSVTGSKMTMAITQAYTAPFIGALVPTIGTGDDETTANAECVHIDFKTAKETVIFLGSEQVAAAVPALLKVVLGAFIAPELQTVTFTANGTYEVKTKADTGISIAGKYTYKNNIVSLELPAAVIEMLKQLAPTMPEMKSLDFIFKADGAKNTFYVNKDMMLPYIALIQGMLPTPPTGDGMTDLIINTVGELKVIMTEATTFDFGLNLTKK